MIINPQFKYWKAVSNVHNSGEKLAGGGEVSPALFLKIEQKGPDFGEKCPDCVHL